MQTFAQRLEMVMSYYQLNKKDFHTRWDITRRGLYNYLDKDQKPDFDALAKFATAFPEINLDWLLKGEGEMVKVADVNNHSHTPATNSNAMELAKQALLNKSVKKMVESYETFMYEMQNVKKLTGEVGF